jgi:hypothetical protein
MVVSLKQDGNVNLLKCNEISEQGPKQCVLMVDLFVLVTVK